MSAIWRRKTEMHLLIALTFLACWAASNAIATCSKNWTSTTVCASSNDPKGAYCDNAFCYCGPRFDETSTSYIERCANPAWGCLPPGRAWYCDCPGLYADRFWTLVDSGSGQPCDCVDGQTQTCETGDGCAGNQTCTNGSWGTCHSNDPCCGNMCCDQGGSGGGPLGASGM